MGEFGAVSVVSGNIARQTQTLPLFVEEAYKQYQTQSAFSAAVLLGGLALITLVLKEILERKTRIKDV
jgi:sulfate transport system permease protein